MAYVVGSFAIFAAVFIPDTVGSGVVRVNPFATLSYFAVMLGAIVFVWMRLSEEHHRLSWTSVFVAVCATVAIVVLPLQFWLVSETEPVPHAWWLRAAHYSSTFLRPDLYWPSQIVLSALSGAAIGRGISWLRRPAQPKTPVPERTG